MELEQVCNYMLKHVWVSALEGNALEMDGMINAVRYMTRDESEENLKIINQKIASLEKLGYTRAAYHHLLSAEMKQENMEKFLEGIRKGSKEYKDYVNSEDYQREITKIEMDRILTKIYSEKAGIKEISLDDEMFKKLHG